VDLLTRLVADPEVDESYSVREERLTADENPDEGAFIVRIDCGPKDKYIRKELLWPYLPEFCDNGRSSAFQN
jgi:sucrose-phosphate synthase